MKHSNTSETAYTYVGKGMPNRESEAKATGDIQYIDDIRLPNMLHGKILFSPYAHAEIVDIDTSEAEKLPGVRAVVHAGNSPRHLYNSAARFYLDTSKSDMPQTEYIFDSTVRFVGDRIAAVAADDPFIAAQAVKLIKVTYKQLPSSITLEQAIDSDSPQANPFGVEGTNVCGGYLAYGSCPEEEVLKAVYDSDHQFETTFRTSRVHHGYMEPVCHIAHYTRDGKLTVWTSSQNVFCFRDVLSTALNMPQNAIRVIKTVCGGAFGGKLEIMHEPVAALLSMKTRRPVKIRLDRRETFASSRSRHEGILTVKSGVSSDGTVTAQHVASQLNTGAYAGSGPNTVGAQSGKTFILYRAPKMFYRGASFYTNSPIAGAMRGYGCPQITVTREVHIDRIARSLAIDPTDFRLKNCIRAYENNCMGNNMHNALVSECIEKGRTSFSWFTRRAEAEKTHGQNIRRGVGMDIAVHGNGWYPVYQDFTSISIRMNNDGSASLLTGTHDLGTGSKTILAQIAAEVLSISPELIDVYEADTATTPLDLGAQASRTTYIGGNAAILAARDVRDQLLHEASSMLGVPAEELKLQDGYAVHRERPEMRCTYTQIIGSAQSGIHGPQREIAALRTFESKDSIDSYAAVFCEVDVDISTGMITPREILAVHNSGTVINPMLFEGQVHGGIHMGLGYALSEEMEIDAKTGKVSNPTFRKYRMFTADQMPRISVELVESPEEAGPFGAKSIGECATDGVAGAVVNAVSHALGGADLDRIPLTPSYIARRIAEEHIS